MKNATVPGILGVCTRHPKSQWTRPLNFAQIWRVPQEAKSDRATFASMITSGSAIAVGRVARRLARGEEP
jgi:hypothetical protein